MHVLSLLVSYIFQYDFKKIIIDTKSEKVKEVNKNPKLCSHKRLDE